MWKNVGAITHISNSLFTHTHRNKKRLCLEQIRGNCSFSSDFLHSHWHQHLIDLFFLFQTKVVQLENARVKLQVFSWALAQFVLRLIELIYWLFFCFLFLLLSNLFCCTRYGILVSLYDNGICWATDKPIIYPYFVREAGQERFRSVTHAYYRDAHGEF